MKNQYFGDNKDMFTYDLIMHLMQAGLTERFTFIPMLTPPDGKPHGEKLDRSKARCGAKNTDLVKFLDDCVKQGKRDIRQIEEYFNSQGNKTTIYGADTYFTNTGRQDYFNRLGGGLLKSALIIVDPDNGLEVKNSTAQHILYSEVNDIYSRMDTRSILMLVQRFPRRPHMEYLNMRCEEIKEKVMADYPVCIDDDEIAFFFLTKNTSLEHKLLHLIGEYSERYCA